ncbi:hypothetical protein [Catellatospora citrea]|uniref:Uncharacterized protein n=1 Tax=Catellatospora citrea TaxID=53366 RepID=A0A8J3KEL4_9ACTN|nr:hypothetical protein [Catellatospora citrea]RKE10346.1 hypothetical protein C8E86_5241 [Catellatospora citrea]GIF99149.1 hypothetical protein Cci01nite_42430 [Catellatospora citrea]
MFTTLCAAIEVRLRTLLSPAVRDRGEGPVPHIVLVAIMALAAAAIAAAVWEIADGWMQQVPTDAPAGPGGGAPPAGD